MEFTVFIWCLSSGLAPGEIISISSYTFEIYYHDRLASTGHNELTRNLKIIYFETFMHNFPLFLQKKHICILSQFYHKFIGMDKIDNMAPLIYRSQYLNLGILCYAFRTPCPPGSMTISVMLIINGCIWFVSEYFNHSDTILQFRLNLQWLYHKNRKVVPLAASSSLAGRWLSFWQHSA